MRLNLRNFRASRIASTLSALALVLGIGVIASTIVKNNANADVSDLVPQRTDVSAPIVSATDGTSKLTSDRTFANASVAQIYDGNFGSTGALGNFHIITFNNFDQTQQAYGNIAVNYLTGDGNNIAHFDIPTANYIKSADDEVILHSFYAGDDHANSSVLIVGNDVNAGGKPSQNATDGFGELWTFNGADMNGPRRKEGEDSVNYYDNLWKEDVNGPAFLDLAAVKADAIEQNQLIRNTPDTNTVTGTTARTDQEMNHKYLRISNDEGANYVTINAYDLLDPTTEIEVVGFDQNKPSSLVVNVDLKDYPEEFELKSGFRICYDDGKANPNYFDPANNKFDPESGKGLMDEWHVSHEAQLNGTEDQVSCLRYKVTDYQYPNHIILNVFDSSKSDGVYTGKVTTRNHSSSTIIAPGASVEVAVDGLQGIIIANNIDLVGDSYYLSLNDLTPLTPDPEYTLTVTYVWEDGSEAAPTKSETGKLAGDTWNETGTRSVNFHGTALNYPGDIVLDPAYDAASGTFSDHNIRVQYIYKMHPLDVIYAEEGENDTYTEISHKDTQYIPDGGNYAEEPIDLTSDGYEYVGIHSTSSPVSTTNMKNSATVVFIYRKKSYALTVTYVWEDGSEAATQKYQEGFHKNDTWDETGTRSVNFHGTALDYPGEIVLDPAYNAASGTFDDSNVRIQFIYKMHSLDVIYAERGENNAYTEISHKDTQYIPDGGNYAEEPIDLTAQDYEYYDIHSTSDPATKTNMKANATVIFLYDKIKRYNLTVTYVWEDGSEAAPTKSETGKLAGDTWEEAGVTEVSYHGRDIDYAGVITLDPAYDEDSGTFSDRNIRVQFIYKMHSLDVIYAEEGENDTYTEFESKDRVWIPDGGSYSETEKDFSSKGYEYVGVHSTSSETSTDNMTKNETVIFIYKKKVPENPDTASHNIWMIGLGSVSFIAASFFLVNRAIKR